MSPRPEGRRSLYPWERRRSTAGCRAPSHRGSSIGTVCRRGKALWCDPDDEDAEDKGGDAEDVQELYSLLENKVMPSFENDEAWATIMRRNFTTCVPVFNTERMLKDYCKQLYAPENA